MHDVVYSSVVYVFMFATEGGKWGRRCDLNYHKHAHMHISKDKLFIPTDVCTESR